MDFINRPGPVGLINNRQTEQLECLWSMYMCSNAPVSSGSPAYRLPVQLSANRMLTHSGRPCEGVAHCTPTGLDLRQRHWGRTRSFAESESAMLALKSARRVQSDCSQSAAQRERESERGVKIDADSTD